MAGIFECIICYSPLTSTDSYVITKCGHTFQGKCIKQWLNTSDNCPNCRVRTTEKQLLKLYLKEGDAQSEMETKCRCKGRDLDCIILMAEADRRRVIDYFRLRELKLNERLNNMESTHHPLLSLQSVFAITAVCLSFSCLITKLFKK